MMKTKTLLFIFVGLREGVQCFTVSAPLLRTPVSGKVKVFVASSTTEEKIGQVDVPSTPASVFGRPLDDDTKKRNHDLVHTLKAILFDNLYAGDNVGRAYARFYALETIARMPYFSYLSVLHLFETLGLWRRAEYLKIHFSETWNELHHLLIMEELGGNSQFRDRFVAQHVAFFYYWIVVALYLYNPTLAYNLNQAVEEEAYQTYDKFLTENESMLKGQPAPEIAKEYYRDGDLYMFDQMHASNCEEVPRRPKCDSLFDVFVAIRDDEKEHVKTMAHLQLPDEDTCHI